ncbi:glycerol kinase GlpK [Myxococcota bacterium]|nr:glycerol kinase GlpK [Myxococcota bacterium]MBU1432418.1 glycerol kinase GlpK [Myxococcota bacterium]MBU1897310.1 glycerol kinase GlpK [Myxococcota bacterium]
MSFILAIDQGTTGSTALILDDALRVLGRHNQEFPQLYPQPGWVEHDLKDILTSVEGAVAGALAQAGIDPAQIAGIGITNQRETTALWSRATGTPVHNAIVWQCRRTAPRCEALAPQAALFKRKTGLVLDPYFSGTKLAWLLDERGHRAAAEAGELAFGTIDSFLVWHLTGGEAHVTDASNASRTLMMNLKTLSWDPELLSLLKIPSAVLPEIRSNSEIYGYTRGFPGLPDGIPVAGMAGDQQSALFGQACFQAGEAKCTYGTGAFLLMNTGEEVVYSDNGLLTTVAWRLGEQTTYALEGSAFIAGAAVQWLRDGLGLIKQASEVEALAARCQDNGGVYFVPALTGLGAPHWRPDARGVIRGLTRGTTAAHLARAALEGIAFQNDEILKAMESDLGHPLAGLRVDGGAAANDLLMQFQADLLGVEIARPALLETTALGAAFLAGLAVGVWSDLDALRAAWREDRRFRRVMDQAEVAARVAGWRAAVACA